MNPFVGEMLKFNSATKRPRCCLDSAAHLYLGSGPHVRTIQIANSSGRMFLGQKGFGSTKSPVAPGLTSVASIRHLQATSGLSMSRSTLTAVAPLVFVCLWATGFVGARLGMPHSEPGTFLAIRFGTACILLAAVAALVGAKWPRGVEALHAVVIGFLIHGVYLGSVFWSIDRGMPAGVSAVIVGLQPLLTAILAGWWLGETITGKHWLGIAFGISGVALVIGPGLDLASSGITPATVSICCIGMVSVTLGTLYQKAKGGQMDIRSSTSLQYLGAFVPVFLLAAVSETQKIDWNAEMVIAMLWAIVVLSVGAIFLLMWLIRQGSVARLSTLFFMVPAVAALMSFGLFGETLSATQIGGMVLCALAVALASSKPPATVKSLGSKQNNP